MKLALQEGKKSGQERSDFDMDQEGWKELAKEGTMKFMTPCQRPSTWTPPPELMQKLALAPDDAATLKQAYARSEERLWAAVKPACAAILGSATAAEKVGINSCVHLIVDEELHKADGSYEEAVRQVAEVRAGVRPSLDATVAKNSMAGMYMAMSGEMKAFENDLARTMGPEEAHRVAWAEGMCAQRNTFGGGSRPK